MKIFIKMSRTFKLRNMLTITIKIFIKVSLKNWKKKEKKVSILGLQKLKCLKLQTKKSQTNLKTIK